MLTCTIRPFEAGRDLEAVTHLYMEYGGTYLPVPDPDDLVDAANDGMLFVATEDDGMSRGRTLGAAGLFRMATCETASGRAIEVYEMAGMVLSPTLRGWGLQGIMLALRALTLARGARTNSLLMASVVQANVPSLRNLTKAGFVPCSSPAWLQASHRSWNLGTADVIDLVMPPSAVQAHAQMLANAVDTPVRTRKLEPGLAASLRVQFSIDWLREERDVLEDYRAGEVPDWDVVIPQARLVGRAPDWIRFKPIIR